MIREEELLYVKGGAISWTVVGIGGAILSFLIGLIDGYTRPLKCRN